MVGFQPISFGFTMRNVEGDLGADGIQKLCDQYRCCDPVHIIVPKNQDAFLSQNCVIYAADGRIHILHGGWIRELVERRSQKTVRQGRGVDAPVYQKGCDYRAAFEMSAEAIDHVGLWLKNIPLFHKKAYSG